MNKPKGVITSTVDPEKRRTVIDILGSVDVRVYPVGRLDFDTEGVLLLTNDGALANGLLHPSSEIWKVYEVKVKGRPVYPALDRLRKGLVLADGSTAPAKVKVAESTGRNTWLVIGLTGGRYHPIKRMCTSVGLPVLKLRRVEFAGLHVDEMNPGEWRYLKPKEVGRLWAVVNSARAAAEARKRRVGAAGARRAEPARTPSYNSKEGFAVNSTPLSPPRTRRG
jgi:23S rRNA pseudouridine2605 synthase